MQRNPWNDNRSLCKVWKVSDDKQFNGASNSLWVGWCFVCNKSTAQYWSFGATLGATLYHIHIEHKELLWQSKTDTSSSQLIPTQSSGLSSFRRWMQMKL